MKPKALENIDWSSVIEQAQAHLDYVESPDYHEDNDNDHYLFEEVMMTVFGRDIFDWINEQTDRG